MYSVEEKTSHHENGIKPQTHVGWCVMSDVKYPRCAYTGYNEDQGPLLPSEEQRFTHKYRCKDGIAYKDRKM